MENQFWVGWGWGGVKNCTIETPSTIIDDIHINATKAQIYARKIVRWHFETWAFYLPKNRRFHWISRLLTWDQTINLSLSLTLSIYLNEYRHSLIWITYQIIEFARLCSSFHWAIGPIFNMAQYKNQSSQNNTKLSTKSIYYHWLFCTSRPPPPPSTPPAHTHTHFFLFIRDCFPT